MTIKHYFWCIWLLATITLLSCLAYTIFLSEDKSVLLIGKASHGHYQIEMSCVSCHTDSFSGEEDFQSACVNCHGKELKLVDDTHPKRKFTDPRNADRTKILDARYCVTCHTEHQAEYTLGMGLTIPQDFCIHCHQDIAEERPSHKDIEYNSCANAGCHNFHDNSSLYQDFLVRHANEPVLNAIARLSDMKDIKSKGYVPDMNLSLSDQILPLDIEATIDSLSLAKAAHEWEGSAHANAGINCLDCHSNQNEDSKKTEADSQVISDLDQIKSGSTWIAKPDHLVCSRCHEYQTETYYEGKHGMRISPYLQLPLSPLRPSMSDLPFKADSLNREHGCNTCHGAHGYETEEAAVGGCLSCHDDDHSTHYKGSIHFALWQKEISGELPPGSGVSCASCHMPREEIIHKGEKMVQVTHNQNTYFQPNEKMIRPVCMQCHGLSFALDALADKTLIENNFKGKPAHHIPSIDWAIKRDQKPRKE